MASWYQLNENNYINTDNINLLRVRENLNDDSWVVEALDLKGVMKIHSCQTENEALELLKKIVGLAK